MSHVVSFLVLLAFALRTQPAVAQMNEIRRMPVPHGIRVDAVWLGQSAIVLRGERGGVPVSLVRRQDSWLVDVVANPAPDYVRMIVDEGHGQAYAVSSGGIERWEGSTWTREQTPPEYRALTAIYRDGAGGLLAADAEHRGMRLRRGSNGVWTEVHAPVPLMSPPAARCVYRGLPTLDHDVVLTVCDRVLLRSRADRWEQVASLPDELAVPEAELVPWLPSGEYAFIRQDLDHELRWTELRHGRWTTRSIRMSGLRGEALSQDGREACVVDDHNVYCWAR